MATTTATIESTESGYHRVQYGVAEVTVRNDGMISLPTLVPPEEAQDMAGAIISAQPIAERQMADNEKAQEAAEAFFHKQAQEAQAAVAQARKAVEAEQRRRTRAQGSRRARATAEANAEPQVQRRKSGGPRGAARATRATVPPAAKAPAKKAAAKKTAAKKAPAKKAAKKVVTRAAQRRNNGA